MYSVITDITQMTQSH